MSTKRINLWAGPRNISTALMYSFANRNDTKVVDEPLYGFYLKNSNAKNYHPNSEETMNSMECDASKVVEQLMGPHDAPIAFFKQMTHHILPGFDLSFVKDCTNILLTRDPLEMLPSYAKEVDHPTMQDVGYKGHIELLSYLNSIGQTPPVLDSTLVLKNPEGVLKKLCDLIDIPFQNQMLSWTAGSRSEDGVWAKIWYQNVHKSTGFQKYKPKESTFPEYLIPLLNDCKPYYDQLNDMAIR